MKTWLLGALTACTGSPTTPTRRVEPPTASEHYADATAPDAMPKPRGRDGELLAEILSHREELQRCYVESLKRDEPSMTRKLVISFYIDDRGRPDQLRVRGEMSAALFACVRAVMDRWELSAAGGPFEVELLAPP